MRKSNKLFKSFTIGIFISAFVFGFIFTNVTTDAAVREQTTTYGTVLTDTEGEVLASENSIMYGSFGENLGRYQFTPKEIISGWHNSAKHYACMMSEKYTRVGIGIAQDSEGYYYWSAIFMD